MKKLALAILVLSFISCKEKNDDKVKEVDKNGSVETKVHITHLTDSLDVMKTENIFWVKNQEAKRVIRLDTIPSLGVSDEQGENSSGQDTTIKVRKNYQIFITVN
ncbi:hypothetical protein TH53_14615 [Pedobacter lusitanus]|uniref:Uncharacterized protein n=1 Tax=Pedobacter lusitanus TaxID=1503925 RepID=A0A0D0GJZ4_9SPHI|nr:hypothetical protein [Pedobacter lusitanus]KIO76470.1 hypothetical protein TH53_14615 [Pedobacter lusitanus]